MAELAEFETKSVGLLMTAEVDGCHHAGKGGGLTMLKSHGVDGSHQDATQISVGVAT